MAERFKAIRTKKTKRWVGYDTASEGYFVIEAAVAGPECFLDDGKCKVPMRELLSEMKKGAGEPCEIVTVELRVIEDEKYD